MLENLQTEAKSVFCLASGNTPKMCYQTFSEFPNIAETVEKLKVVSLDEWVGVKMESVGSCYQILNNDLFSLTNLSDEQVCFFDGMTDNLEEETLRVDKFISKKPYNFLLSWGRNEWHIGLNELWGEAKCYSSIVELSERTKDVAQNISINLLI